MIIKCQYHGLTEHAVHKRGKGTRFKCKKCNVEAVQRSRLKIKEKAIEYKGGKCQCCTYNKYNGALEFHHLDSTKKDFGVSDGNYRSWNKVKEEIDKCILVCSNCHKEIHAGLIKI